MICVEIWFGIFIKRKIASCTLLYAILQYACMHVSAHCTIAHKTQSNIYQQTCVKTQKWNDTTDACTNIKRQQIFRNSHLYSGSKWSLLLTDEKAETITEERPKIIFYLFTAFFMYLSFHLLNTKIFLITNKYIYTKSIFLTINHMSKSDWWNHMHSQVSVMHFVHAACIIIVCIYKYNNNAIKLVLVN